MAMTATGDETAPPIDFSGFAWWHALLVPSNSEQKAAATLARFQAHVYLPLYSRRVRRRGKLCTRRLYAAIPGLILCPEDMMAIPRRDEVFAYAGIRDYIRTSSGLPARIPESEVEKIRTMEAKLNLPPNRKGVLFSVGDKVTFVDDLYQDWGTGVVVEIVSEGRIGVEVGKLFGRPTKVYVPASEIETLKPTTVGTKRAESRGLSSRRRH